MHSNDGTPSFSESVRIGGTLVWYVSICHRQVWLMARGIDPDERNELLILGRLVDQNRYARDKHNISYGANRFDMVRKDGNTIVVSEVKKSSRSIESAKLQLLHYLYELKKAGVYAKGELLFPEERKREELSLTEADMIALDKIYQTIEKIAILLTPPEAEHTRYCKKCAYAEYCWS